MDVGQLRTLAQVVESGTFERAAQELHITAPAVSQRIRALEREVGKVLVHRTVPIHITESGEPMLRLARQVLELHRSAMAEMGQGPEDTRELAIAVNADSVSTWFTGVLAEAHAWRDVSLYLHLEDEDHSRHLLQSGEVSSAITTSAKPVAGCRIVPLGSMRFRPMIAPTLLEEFGTSDGGVDLARCPLVMFSPKDDLQHEQLAAFRDVLGHIDPPHHTIPSSEAFVRAIADGLGWGMVATLQLAGARFAMTDADLAVVPGIEESHVQLYFQRWSTDTPALARLEQSVRRHAAVLGDIVEVN